MKTSFALLAVAASLAAAVPQSLSDLPPCGQTCISNMLGLGPSFGCATGDQVCYCTEPNFGYGVRDCSNEACGASDAVKVIAFGEQYCKNLLASASVTGGSALTILSSAASAASSVASEVAANATATGPSVTAITVVPLFGVVSGATVSTGVSTVFSTISGALASGGSSAISAASSVESSLASGASSAASAASSGASSAASAASSGASSAASAASSVAASLASGASSAAASATSSGKAAMITAAPILGGAAMAALLFI